MRKKLDFLRQSLKNFRTVGSFVRSSDRLAVSMASNIDWSAARTVVELGAGDGAITEKLLQKLGPDGRLIAFEINELFCETLVSKFGSDDRFVLAAESAENLCAKLTEQGLGQADAIVSALPFISLPDELARTILTECHQALRKGGLFVQLHYSPHRKGDYEQVFGNAIVDFEPLNVPPAFIIVCKKNG